MIGPDSILRRLPSQLNRKQVLFFDGIRHAVEMIDLAHLRLQDTLTQIALSQNDTPPNQNAEFTWAFLDAWVIVDAIDRLRSLFHSMPNTKKENPPPPAKSFNELCQPIRDLRNVADHLAQRADYVIANNGTALGELSWYTHLTDDGTKGVSCLIVPGTIASRKSEVVIPAGGICTYPTGMIHLSAGGYRACLSDLLPEVEKRVRALEAAVEQEIAKLGIEGQRAGADVCFKCTLMTTPEKIQDDQ